MTAPFEFFDRSDDFSVTRRHLPHWEQAGRTYFITFRTADSIPVSLLRQWHERRRDWLLRQKIDPDREDWTESLAQLSELLQRQFHETVSREFHRYLDDCHGACVLRRPELAAIVGSSLRFFDSQRYRLGDFVVMPNHVHVLVQLLAGVGVKAQCRSWKRYSAGKINEKLNRSGRFWQDESFDHLVRGPEQFERLRRYIADNPKKANLGRDEYLYYAFDA